MSFDFKDFSLIYVKFYGPHPCNPYHRVVPKMVFQKQRSDPITSHFEAIAWIPITSILL